MAEHHPPPPTPLIILITDRLFKGFQKVEGADLTVPLTGPRPGSDHPHTHTRTHTRSRVQVTVYMPRLNQRACIEELNEHNISAPTAWYALSDDQRLINSLIIY